MFKCLKFQNQCVKDETYIIYNCRSLIKKLKAYREPWLFERHLYFLDVTKYGMSMPMYINLVREPVARFVSGYYYKRFENPVPMSNEDRNRTIDECVFGNNWEVFAIFLFFSIILFSSLALYLT